jgi:hypothetical protein
MHAGAGRIAFATSFKFEKQKKRGLHQFRNIATGNGFLVKNTEFALREHGDGIVRGEFFTFMIGQQNYELLKELNLPLIPTLFECW